MADNSITARNDEGRVQTREEMRSSEHYLRPAVNIIETPDGLTLTADLPGAAKADLDVNVEKGILTISAPAKHALPGNPVYREFELATYYRQFTIPESLDHEKAHAEYANGILTLKVPKAEVAKPKRIAIQAS